MMKTYRAILPAVALGGLLTLGLAGPASAFHEGGVAHCDGCHTMHNSADNPIGEGATANNTLLKGSDPSSTCLNCHAGAGSATSYHIMSTDATVQSPGGDFYWLTQSYTNTVRGTPVTSDPDQMGHNVIASDYGLLVDGNNTTAPGGDYEAAFLGCNSCHDPHGVVDGGTANGGLPISVSGSYGEEPAPGTIAGNYRLLASTGYEAPGGNATFAPAPIAVIAESPGKYGEADDNHVAYGTGMSEWCASCHGTFINDSHKHPAGNGEYLNGQAANYNSYVATGDFTGNQATSFLALVPFERQVTDKATLLAQSPSTEGPITGNENVMCLTCHRAHASAFTNITRWDVETELLADSFPNAQNLIDMGAVPNSAYYGRDIATEFGEFQRSLCNKCHVKD